MTKTKLYLGFMPLILQDLKYLLNNELAINSHIDALKGTRALSYTCGRALIKYALLNEGVIAQNELLPNITYSNLGKPSLDSKGIYFNLSHSNQVMALSLGPYEQGVDIELCNEKRLRPSLLQKVLNESELHCLNAKSSSYEQALFFTRQWTLRECLVKSQGNSIFSMDSLEIDPVNMTIKAANYPLGIIATFEINMSEYFNSNDKIYHLESFEMPKSSLKVTLDKINCTCACPHDLKLGTLDYSHPDVKRLEKAHCYQLSVFLECDYEKYQSLQLAVADNLEIWGCFAVNNAICQHSPFTPIKCSPKAVFTVN